MSTVDRPRVQILPPLVAGQRMDQPTFHERYEAMGSGTWAELVDGVVYMPSPVSEDHGGTDDNVGGWLYDYRKSIPALKGGANATVKLGRFGQPHPDRQLRIRPEFGGSAGVEAGYVVGPPELVVEVSWSSREFDLGPKKRDYEKAGVQEYVVFALEPDEVFWFVRRDGRFVELAPGEDGIFRSEAFPGLWLDPAALFAEDLDRVTAILDQGRATPEHAAFVARLAKSRRARP